MKNILLALTFLISGLITTDLFLKEPPVWPDEATLAIFASQYNGNFLNSYLAYPSVYSSLLYYWTIFFGNSIEAQRAFSVTAGFLLTLIFFLLVVKVSKKLFKESYLQVIPVILLITDFAFLQSTRIGRPEIFSLLAGMTSIYFLYLFISEKFKNLLFFGISLVAAISAFFFHANGFFYAVTVALTGIISFKKLSEKNRKIMTFLAFCFGFFSVFLIQKLIPKIPSILSRLKISYNQESWLLTVFNSKPLEFKLTYLVFIITTFLFLIFTYQKKRLDLVVIALPLIFAWLVLIFNKDVWYAVYLIPFILLALYIMLENSYTEWKNKKSSEKTFNLIVLTILCLVIFLSNLKLHLSILANEGGDKFSYKQYSESIKKIIPDNKSIFTSAIPDPFYAFLDRKNDLIRFPQSYIEPNSFLEMLNSSDYIIYNGPFNDRSNGNLVWDYLKLNYLKFTEIGGPDQYAAVVVELKPRDQRKNP